MAHAVVIVRMCCIRIRSNKGLPSDITTAYNLKKCTGIAILVLFSCPIHYILVIIEKKASISLTFFKKNFQTAIFQTKTPAFNWGLVSFIIF